MSPPRLDEAAAAGQGRVPVTRQRPMSVGDPIDMSQPLDTGGRRIDLVQVHHTGGNELRTPAEVEQDALARHVGFRCDPYTIHLWRGPDLRSVGVSAWCVSWGRDPEKEPAGEQGDNDGAIAVVVHGDYSREPLPIWARDLLVEVLAWACRSLGLSADAVRGHRELPGDPTLCPGFDCDEIRSLLAAELARTA